MRKFSILTTLALSMLLTAACTVSDNPSGGDNTGAGDHNVRRYRPISPSTESVNWDNYGFTASDADNTFFMEIENNIQRLYAKNMKTGKLTIIHEIEVEKFVSRFMYPFVEDGYLYYYQETGNPTYHRVKTDLSKMPETNYCTLETNVSQELFARQGKKIYLYTYEDDSKAIKVWDIENNTVEPLAISPLLEKYTPSQVTGGKLIAYKLRRVNKRTREEIASFDMNTGEKTILVDSCNYDTKKGAILDGRLYYATDNELCSVELDGNNRQTHLSNIEIGSINSHDGLIYFYTRYDEGNPDLYTYKPGDDKPQLLKNDFDVTFFKMEISPYGDVMYRKNNESDDIKYYCVEKATGKTEPLIATGETAERLTNSIILTPGQGDAYTNYPKTLEAMCLLENNATDIKVTWTVDGKKTEGTLDTDGKTRVTTTFTTSGLKDASVRIDYSCNGVAKSAERKFQLIVLFPYSFDERLTPHSTLEDLKEIYPDIKRDNSQTYILQDPEDSLHYTQFNVNNTILVVMENAVAKEKDPLANLNKFIDNVPDDLKKLSFTYAIGHIMGNEMFEVISSPKDIEGITTEEILALKKWKDGEATEEDHPTLLAAVKRLGIDLMAARYYEIPIATSSFSAYATGFFFSYSQIAGNYRYMRMQSYPTLK